MDKVDKTLKRLNEPDQQRASRLIEKILANQLDGLDIKKLTSQKNAFRVRSGNIRVIFELVNGRNKVTGISHRSEKTYRDL